MVEQHQRFELSWSDAYRVSVPNLLPNPGDRLEVVDAESYDRLRTALEEIVGHFIPGQRKTYASPDKTLDLIRHEAETALLRRSD